ncbi:MAG: hypothetical protein QXG65_01000 [Thermoplasmata archaeon]
MGADPASNSSGPGHAAPRRRRVWVDLDRRPSVAEGLRLGVVNESAAARLLAETGNAGGGSTPAIAIALHRRAHQDRTDPHRQRAQRVMTTGSQILLRTGYRCDLLRDEDEVWRRLLEAPPAPFPSRDRRPPSVIFSVQSAAPRVTVAYRSAVSGNEEEGSGPPAPWADLCMSTTRLSMAILEAGPDSADVPGVIAEASQAIAERGICPEIVLTSHNQIFVAAQPEEARHAYEALRDAARPSGPERLPDESSSPPRGIPLGPMGDDERPDGPPRAEGAERETAVETARRFLARHQSLADCLSLGIVNLAALARRISAETGDSRTDAIEIALRREQARPPSEGTAESRVLAVAARTSLEMRTGVAILSAPNAPEALARILSVGLEAAPDRRRLFQILQSPASLTILCGEDLVERVVQAVGGGPSVRVRRDLVAAILRSPPEIQTTPGILAYFARTIARADVNCLEMMSLGLESTFVVAREDSVRTFETLVRAIRPAPAPGDAEAVPSRSGRR